MRLSHFARATIAALTITACADNAIVQPSRSANGVIASMDKGGTSDRTVNMMDACDGPSFSALGILCTRNHGVSFSDLFGQLASQGFAGAWHNAPSEMDARVGLTLSAV